MVKLVLGHKGSGKTKQLVEAANDRIEEAKGSFVFINKDKRLMYDLKHSIRFICMEEFPGITNINEYIGFIYGIISSDSDLEEIYIDSLMKHTDVSLEDIPVFLRRINVISDDYDVDFCVSVSAEKDELAGVDFSGFEVIS